MCLQQPGRVDEVVVDCLAHSTLKYNRNNMMYTRFLALVAVPAPPSFAMKKVSCPAPLAQINLVVIVLVCARRNTSQSRNVRPVNYYDGTERAPWLGCYHNLETCIEG